MPGLIGSLYAGAATVAAPGLRAMLRRRAGRGKELAERLTEREGLERAARPAGRLVWLHAASVGESLSVLPVIEAVRRRCGATVLVTTGTVTSAALLAERVPGLGMPGCGVIHRFVPLDVPGWVGAFVGHWRPDVAVFVESELWPNLLAACRRAQVPTLLLNGRMSARSLRAWGWARGLAREMLAGFEHVHPQSEEDGARLMARGARTVEAAGNLKLAAAPLPADETELARLRAVVGGRPIWLAASTHPGEEAVVASVHQALLPAFPDLVTAIVPRHPGRGPELAQMLGGRLRSAGADPQPGEVWLADGLGELGLLYRLSPVVLVGRSLLPPGGGQNVFEPARLGCAVAVGPYTGNFASPVQRLAAAGALSVVADGAALQGWVAGMLADPERRATMARAARAVAQGETDLVERVTGLIVGAMGRAG